jgi:hypothetical protein
MVLGRNRSFDNSDNGNTTLQEPLRVTIVVQELGSSFECHNTGTLGLQYTLSRELGNFLQCPSDVSALLINLNGRGHPLVANMLAFTLSERRA